MSDMFSHAGVSKLKGEFKVRFCNGAERVKVLAKNGHEAIDIIELKKPMTKEDVVAYLLKIDFDNGNKAIRACLEAEAEKRGVKIKVKETKEIKPVVEAEVPKVEDSTVGKLIEQVGEAPM